MKRWMFSRALVASAVFSFGHAVVADDEKPQAAASPEQLFKELDKNSDGQLSLDEVSESQKRFFERLVRVGDKNSDGKLSSEEFQNAAKADDRPVDAPRGDAGGPNGRPNPEEMFKRLDVNGDGKVTKDEVPERAKAFLAPFFERLGKDEITKDDLTRLANRGGAGGSPFGQNPQEFFKRLDTNGDGKVTAEEAPERGRQVIERMLENLGRGKDGSVSKEEFLAAAERFQGPGRRPGAEGRPGGERRPNGDRPPEGAPGRGPRDGDRPPLPRFFEKLDTNHDVKISKDELAKAAENLKELDEDGDGQLDPRELLGLPPDGDMRARGRGPEGDPPGGRGRPNAGDRRPEPGRGPAGGRPFFEQFVKQFDKNGDGKISLDEAPERLKDRFGQMDRNADGQLEANEFPGRGDGGPGAGRRPGGGRPNQGGRPESDKPEEPTGDKNA